MFSAYSAEQLADATEYRFGTVDGGEQLRLVHSPRRRLLQLGVGVEDPDDLGRIAGQLERLELPVTRDQTSVATEDPGSEVRVVVEIAPGYDQKPTPWPPTNTPGLANRVHQRAAGVLRDGAVHPRKLGHVVIGSTDQEASTRFFTDGLGFKVSDRVPFLAAFMRCSTDHHNVLVQQAPVSYLHHTSWQVDDADEIGRGATAMLAKDRAGTCGAWAGTSSARTTSGTCATRPATSPSTTATSTASSTTSCGPPASGRATPACTSGGPLRRRPSSPPKTSPASWPAPRPGLTREPPIPAAPGHAHRHAASRANELSLPAPLGVPDARAI